MEDYYSTDALFMTGNQYLAHHGMKGMHWGVRRYQNSDGSLTSAGRRRVVDDYQRKELKRLNRTYDPTINKEKKKMDRTINKIGKQLTSRNPNARKVRKLRSNLEFHTTRYAYHTMAKALESKAIKNATLSSISAERKAVGKARIRNALVTLGSAVLAYHVPTIYIPTVAAAGTVLSENLNTVKSNYRISDSKRKDTLRKAKAFSSKNTAKLFGETGTRRKSSSPRHTGTVTNKTRRTGSDVTPEEEKAFWKAYYNQIKAQQAR